MQDWNRDHLIEIDEASLAEVEGMAALQKLKDDLNTGFYAKALLAENAMRQEVAALESAPLVTNEGNLRPRAVISGEAYHYWGQRLGYQCWDDPTFLKEFERDNPECRVKQRMANPTIVNQWGGAAA
jgi:hypothetical protein